MEEYRMDEHRMGDCRKKRFWKYMGIVFATLLGSFLAFYFAVSCTLSHFMSSAYAMNKIHKADRAVMRDFDRMDKSFSQMNKVGMFQHKSAVDFIKTPDSYKFIVDLTPFQGNQNAVNVDVDGRMITISAEAQNNKNNVETYTKMSQTYSLCDKAKTDKLSKKKVDNKYIITIPIED